MDCNGSKESVIVDHILSLHWLLIIFFFTSSYIKNIQGLLIVKKIHQKLFYFIKQALFWFECFNIVLSCLNPDVISIVIYPINSSKLKDHYHEKQYIYKIIWNKWSTIFWTFVGNIFMKIWSKSYSSTRNWLFTIYVNIFKL